MHIVSIHEDAAEASSRADRAVQFLRAHGVEARRHVQQTDQAPAEVILEKVAEVNSGLIVAGAFGQRFEITR